MDCALLSVGSPFTVGVTEEERDNAVMAAVKFGPPQALGHSSLPIVTPVCKTACEMAATPEHAHVMVPKTKLRHVTAAIPESCNVTAVFPES
ncbi:hypothetical protein M9458_023507, partial [Cirrhinus mrigala]